MAVEKGTRARITAGRGEAQLISIMPQLSVRGGQAALGYYATAFGAVVVYQTGGAEGGEPLVAQLSVGGASFWVCDESPGQGESSPESLGGSTTRMLLITDNPRAMLQRAVIAGGKLTKPPVKEHGWLVGRVQDPFGHQWEIGRPLIAWPPVSGKHHAADPLTGVVPSHSAAQQRRGKQREDGAASGQPGAGPQVGGEQVNVAVVSGVQPDPQPGRRQREKREQRRDES